MPAGGQGPCRPPTPAPLSAADGTLRRRVLGEAGDVGSDPGHRPVVERRVLIDQGDRDLLRSLPARRSRQCRRHVVALAGVAGSIAAPSRHGAVHRQRQGPGGRWCRTVSTVVETSIGPPGRTAAGASVVEEIVLDRR